MGVHGYTTTFHICRFSFLIYSTYETSFPLKWAVFWWAVIPDGLSLGSQTSCWMTSKQKVQIDIGEDIYKQGSHSKSKCWMVTRKIPDSPLNMIPTLKWWSHVCVFSGEKYPCEYHVLNACTTKDKTRKLFRMKEWDKTWRVLDTKIIFV